MFPYPSLVKQQEVITEYVDYIMNWNIPLKNLSLQSCSLINYYKNGTKELKIYCPISHFYLTFQNILGSANSKDSTNNPKIPTSGLSLSCITINTTPSSLIYFKYEELDVIFNFKYLSTSVACRHR